MPKQTAYDPASTLDGTEVIALDQGGVTKKATTAQIRDLGGVRVLAQSSGPVSLTGTTAETAMATITIPAGAMGANGRIEVWAQYTYPNSANSKTIRGRFGGLGGTTIQSAAPTTTTSQSLIFYVQNLNSVSSQIGGVALTTATSASSPAVDTSAAVDLVMSGQLANSSETLVLQAYRVLIYPKG